MERAQHLCHDGQNPRSYFRPLSVPLPPLRNTVEGAIIATNKIYSWTIHRIAVGETPLLSPPAFIMAKFLHNIEGKHTAPMLIRTFILRWRSTAYGKKATIQPTRPWVRDFYSSHHRPIVPSPQSVCKSRNTIYCS